MRRYSKKHNPLPKLETTKDEIKAAIAEICKRANLTSPHESLLGAADDPENLLTPYNLVLYSVEAVGGSAPEGTRPRIRRETLDLLTDDQEPFYRGAIEELEQDTTDRYQEGRIPANWLAEQERRGRKTNILKDKYTLWASDYPGAKPQSYDEFRDRLNYGGKRRKLRRHSR